MGRAEADRKITGEPWLSTLGQRNMTKENTLRSECGSAFKKRLTEPALLEMSGYPTYQDLTAWSVDNFRFADHSFRIFSRKRDRTRTPHKMAPVLRKTAATMGAVIWSPLRTRLFIRSDTAARAGKGLLSVW
jgi:hypothetical protein